MKLGIGRLAIAVLPGCLCLSTLLCNNLLAQEGTDTPKLPDMGLSQADGGRGEMIQLFHKVERRLGEIDRLLYDASAGKTALKSLEESGIANLIKNSSGKSQEVIKDIDKILAIAAKSGGGT